MAYDMLGPLVALFAGMIIVGIILLIAIWIYQGFALMAMAKKKNVPNGWLGFIPIANVYLMTQLGKLPWWWTFAIVLPFIPWIGGLAALIAFIYIWWQICDQFSKPGWWGILMMIPIVNWILMGIMAWGNN